MHELADDPAQAAVRRGRDRADACPRSKIDLDEQGEVVGAHLAKNDESHQVIEEFMLAANEAVAALLTEQHGGFLRRVHEPTRAAQAARLRRRSPASLGIECESLESRFEIKRVIAEVAGPARGTRRPLRPSCGSCKQAVYAPERRGALRPGQRATTATSPRRSAATPTCRSTA